MPQAADSRKWLGLVVRLGAAAVWIVAGVAKIPDIEGFRVQVERYLILPHVFAVPFAYLLPFFEVGLGLYLGAGLFVRGSAFVGSAVMVLFLVAQVQAWARGLSIDCGCFGTLSQTRVGLMSVLRDLALGLPTFVMAAFPARVLSIDSLLGRRASR